MYYYVKGSEKNILRTSALELETVNPQKEQQICFEMIDSLERIG
jgi:hypothetical protein